MSRWWRMAAPRSSDWAILIRLLVGLLADLLLGAWGVDALTSLAIVWFVVKEGREAWRGEVCCEIDH